MEAVSKSPERRTLLQRGLVLLTAVFGMGAAARAAESAAAPEKEAGPITLYGRRSLAPSRLPGRGGARLVRSGEILDRPDGKRIGQFFASGFCMETPLGPEVAAPSNLEFQTFHLPDGTLFGIGGGAAGRGERTLAILGGTGRFTAVRGSYVEREVGPAVPGREAVEFVLTINA
jgi:hypothetical protein